VWAAWHAFAALKNLKPDAFRSRAKVVVDRMAKADPQHPVNPLIRDAFVAKPPRSLKDVAARYADLLNGIDHDWQSQVKRAVDNKRPVPTRMPDTSSEQLRRQFYGAQAPPDVPMAFGWGFLDLLPDRPAQGEFKKLLKAVESWMSKGKGAQPRATSLVDVPTPHDPHVFLRGNPNRPGRAVPRRFPRVLGGARFRHGSGRLELARAVASPENPLTARVIVNRVWQHHFGTPLVSTPSDFGLRSDPPSHPKLLDDLAREFLRNGWSLKRLHRRMMLSATYRQSSADLESAAKPQAVDPDNRLLWRMNRRRLEFEGLRDSLLAVSGSMRQRIGGPPAKMFGSKYVPRRTVYGFVDRLNLPGLLRTFDFPAPAATTAKRDTTTIAPQALFLMNHPFARETARRVLNRPEIAGAKRVEDRTRRLYRLLFSRPPTRDELALAAEFLAGGSGKSATASAWETYVHGLLMTNEFVFVD
ncbi:MAG: DUF1553 domain-containing protein, partial [Planctomycetaceae bacterium]